jgi:hypothetical protein
MIERFEVLRDRLRRAVPPIGDEAPRRDLWPDVVRRLTRPSQHTPWIDWAVAAAAMIACVAVPGVVQTLLYLL